MTATSPLWPATLHHLRIDSSEPEAMADFYEGTLGMHRQPFRDGLIVLTGGTRRVLIGKGPSKSTPFGAFALESRQQLEAMAGYLREKGIPRVDPPVCLFQEGAIAVTDPDGRRVVFGLPEQEPDTTDAMPGRLQHMVVTSQDAERMAEFYGEGLGFVLSDRVLRESGEPTTFFFRSNEEHHSFAVFQSDEVRLDHSSLEVPSWNDIRDWCDYLSEREVTMDWGPGRHGPGNNLFVMLRDPDGNWVEISTELERMPREMASRDWPHTERTLNLWGQGFLRS